MSGYSCAAEIRDGRLVLADEAEFRRAMQRLPPGRVVLRLDEAGQTRSSEQNAWVWGIAYPLIANVLGYDLHEHEDLHYALVAKCFGTHRDHRLGDTEIPNRRSSRLTTKEFSEYMEWLVRFAATEFDCVIPLPNEPISEDR